ncbi:BspA family leucine-rich repeat surface protein [uncultured Ruminococcus sp.]|uniref:BspA family leucine-rich repeat surface protein n=1 Tax=uncultured Ruminococcus sp. TaxID=165186 RepID=UPI0025FEDB9A|nr:BspA family leucine-rich repeat surface protein [uncultured Ruminococcus sp.]
MRFNKILSFALALTLSFSAMQKIVNISDVSFAAESEDDENNYVKGKCTMYDKKNHVLTIFGNVTKEELDKYRSGNNAHGTVEEIIAAPNTVLPENCYNLFANFKDAKYIEMEGVDTSQVTNMWGMFSGDLALAVLHIGSFYTGNVTDMGNMFSGCVNLKYFDEHLETSKVVNMNSMFQLCGSITELDLSNFDTSNVESMDSMFHRCSSLKELNLESFDTSKVKSMQAMFGECSALDTIHLNNFDTSNVISMEGMFGDCTNLKWIDITNFKTSSVVEMNSMFYGCKKLKELDLSSFTISSKLKTMANMFAFCDNLETIKVNENWTHDKISNVQYTQKMFQGCVNIRGGYGTKYDFNHIDGDYARIDTPAFKGYLTSTYAATDSVGDTNNDGKIDATDASNILSKYTEYATSGKTPTPYELAVYDVNGDGKINSVDASYVLSYYADKQTGRTGSFADYMANH